MNNGTGIFLGAIVIALALYFGLTYEKRTWMKSCVEEQNNDKGICENYYAIKN